MHALSTLNEQPNSQQCLAKAIIDLNRSDSQYDTYFNGWNYTDRRWRTRHRTQVNHIQFFVWPGFPLPDNDCNNEYFNLSTNIRLTKMQSKLSKNGVQNDENLL